MKKSKFTDEQIVVDLHQHKAGDLPPNVGPDREVKQGIVYLFPNVSQQRWDLSRGVSHAKLFLRSGWTPANAAPLFLSPCPRGTPVITARAVAPEPSPGPALARPRLLFSVQRSDACFIRSRS